MKALLALSHAVARIEALALAVSLIVMLGVAFYQVVMRNIYGMGYVWADILVRSLVLWVGLLGATIATHESRHLTIDVLTKFLPKRLTRLVHVITRLFAGIVCGCLAVAGYRFFELERLTSTGAGILGLPEWAAGTIIPVAFALITFHFAILIIVGIGDVIKGTDLAAPPQEGV